MSDGWTPLISRDQRRVAAECAVSLTTAALPRPRFFVQDEWAFLLIRLDTTRKYGLDHALASFETDHGRHRIKAAVQAKAALEMTALPARATTGLVLDVVDDWDGSWAQLRSDRWEAVRFDPTFVQNAMEDYRQSQALTAMIDLATRLGLPTIGPALVDCAAVGTTPIFDYLMTADVVRSDAANDAYEPPTAALTPSGNSTPLPAR